MPATDVTTIPQLPARESSGAFLYDGYVFGLNRFTGERRDAFRTRLLGKRAVIMRGREAARIFYDGDRFSRERAMPNSLQHLLQDEGSVQDHEGRAHHHRKAMFARLLMDEAALDQLRALYADEWARAVSRSPERMVLDDELLTVLTRVALRWIGVDPRTVDVDTQSRSLAGMIENAAAVGPANWLARARRRRTEGWAGQLVADVRSGAVKVDEDSPLAQMARHRDADGSLMDEETAAVEVINVLRPTVAVGRFIVWAALALHRHPQWRELFAQGDTKGVWNFVQEVRRFSPFFPTVAGRVQEPFTWHGHDFSQDDWVLLDLFATNYDDRLWDRPKKFDPTRFRDWDGDANSLIPQGAGEVDTGHRCPGERATIALMEEAVIQLTQHTNYSVPEQDLSVSLRKFPAKPASGFVIEFGQ